MPLLEREVEAIRAHPIGEKLDSFWDTFKSTFPDADVTDLKQLEEQVDSETGKMVVLQLLAALQSLNASLRLLSRIESGPLSSDIASLFISISSKSRSPTQAAPLLRLVLEQAKDEEIWSAVFELIDRTRPNPPTTPPPSAPPFQQTPWSYNTGSLADTSELRSQMDALLKQELEPSLRLDVPDLQQACFENIPELDRLAKTVFDRCQEGDIPLYNKQDSLWTQWPADSKEEMVLAWLQELARLFSEWTPQLALYSRQIYQGPGVYLSGSTGKRKVDVSITARREGDKPSRDWAQILVLGELKSNNAKDNHGDAWVDLATYAREVFNAQDRRFVLGFTLCGSMMRLWHFDRLGSSGSRSFDINKDGYHFVHAMLGYFMMDDEQLGLDPTIGKLEGERFIDILRDGQPERLILTVLRKQAVIVGRATTCWRAYRKGDEQKKPLIVKDSWQYEERPEEGELIKEATESEVRHIARYYHHETVQVGGKDDTVITNVRRDKMKTFGRTSFRQQNLAKPEASDPDASGKILSGRLEGQSTSRKRSSSSIRNPSPTKRLRSSQKDEDVTAYDRVHRRVVTRDAGKLIQKASSLVALLNGLIGAINGHESLLNAGILHRDISTGNIMLTEDEDDGFLIDMDLAVRISDESASGAPSKTGTKIFMAIGALRGEHHTFMHDLESFFWVLFWICIHWNGPRKEKQRSRFEKWNYAATEELGEWKKGTVAGESDFDVAVKHFTNYCGPLIPGMRELRAVVFERSWERTDRELYSQMKTTLEKTRESLGTVFRSSTATKSSQQSKDEDVTSRNRVHRRIVTCDAGKPIQDASSLVALITGLIGAINGHESLLNAGILHRDISTGNIMLTEDEDDGFLIDMDLAVKTSNEAASGTPTMTGTKIFMAIGALYSEHHTFMHDLESFFWVLFWICIHWNGPGKDRRKVSRFERWNYLDVEELARDKKGTVDEDDKFSDDVDRYFTTYCRPLVPCIQEMRKVMLTLQFKH